MAEWIWILWKMWRLSLFLKLSGKLSQSKWQSHFRETVRDDCVLRAADTTGWLCTPVMHLANCSFDWTSAVCFLLLFFLLKLHIQSAFFLYDDKQEKKTKKWLKNQWEDAVILNQLLKQTSVAAATVSKMDFLIKKNILSGRCLLLCFPFGRWGWGVSELGFGEMLCTNKSDQLASMWQSDSLPQCFQSLASQPDGSVQ